MGFSDHGPILSQNGVFGQRRNNKSCVFGMKEMTGTKRQEANSLRGQCPPPGSSTDGWSSRGLVEPPISWWFTWSSVAIIWKGGPAAYSAAHVATATGISKKRLRACGADGWRNRLLATCLLNKYAHSHNIWSWISLFKWTQTPDSPQTPATSLHS